MNDLIAECVLAGERLPPGEVTYTPPLQFRTDDHSLRIRGACAHGGTTLVPVEQPAGAGGDLIQLDNYAALGTTGYAPIVLEDLTIRGSGALTHYQTGISVLGAQIRLRNVRVTDCFIGFCPAFAVDVDLTECVLRKNRYNVFVREDAGAVTTLRFHSCNIREAYEHGVTLQWGWDVLFDTCIIESNDGWGLIALNKPQMLRAILRDTWLENNGRRIAGTGNLYDERAVQGGTPAVVTVRGATVKAGTQEIRMGAT